MRNKEKNKSRHYSYHALKVGGKRIDEHRLVMERHLGRKLTKDEVVHHKDGNKLNNAIENLQVMTRSEHNRMHAIERIKAGIIPHGLQDWQKTHRDEIGKWQCIEIDCYTKEGVFVKHYNSMAEAEKDGFKNQHVSDVVNGKRKQYKGHIFKKSENHS